MQKFNIGDRVRVLCVNIGDLPYEQFAADDNEIERIDQVGRVHSIADETCELEFNDGAMWDYYTIELEPADAPAPEAGEPEAGELDNLQNSLDRCTAKRFIAENQVDALRAELARVKAERDALQAFAQAYMEAAAKTERDNTKFTEAQLREAREIIKSAYKALWGGGATIDGFYATSDILAEYIVKVEDTQS